MKEVFDVFDLFAPTIGLLCPVLPETMSTLTSSLCTFVPLKAEIDKGPTSQPFEQLSA